MYDRDSIRVNAVPIKEVRERLRKLIEDKASDSEIDSKLTVEHYSSSSTINFYDIDGQHPDIYKVNEGNNIREEAEKIRVHLKRVFVKINSCNNILKYIQQLNDLNSQFNRYREKLHSTLCEIDSKVELKTDIQCKYLIPELKE